MTMYLKLYKRVLKIFDNVSKRKIPQIVLDILKELTQLVQKKYKEYAIFVTGDLNLDHSWTVVGRNGVTAKSTDKLEQWF